MGQNMGEEQTTQNAHRGKIDYWHWARMLIAVLVIGGACWLLYNQLKDVSPAQILAGIRGISPWNVLLAIGLTFLNYAILVGYDWAGTRYVQHPLKFGRIVLASFICYALSHNFGWFLGGPPSRYRLYSAAGLNLLEIAKLVAILWVAYWTGFFALAGLVFIIWPPSLPPYVLINNKHVDLPELSARPLGIVFIVGVCLYLAATALWRTPVKWRGQQFNLPPFSLSVFMVTIAMLDIGVGSSVLYVLLPPEMNVSLPAAMSVYLMGMVVVITLHIPGGVGVFEAVVIAMLAPGDSSFRDELVGSLIVYRAVYYLLPLISAFAALGGHEFWLLGQLKAVRRAEQARPEEELESRL
jgi:uncharacterized membrane protein YbhN (UPF0104 family)